MISRHIPMFTSSIQNFDKAVSINLVSEMVICRLIFFLINKIDISIRRRFKYI